MENGHVESKVSVIILHQANLLMKKKMVSVGAVALGRGDELYTAPSETLTDKPPCARLFRVSLVT